MKKSLIHKLIIPCTVALVGSLASCTKSYDTINTDSNKITSVSSATLPYLFGAAEDQMMFASSYQVSQNLCADLYAQYFATTATYFPSDRYVMRSDWFISAWSCLYTGVVPQLQTIFANTDSSSVEYAMANVVWAFSFARITDYWGPIPYSKAGIVADSVTYDSQETIYKDLFKRLDSSIYNFTQNAGTTASFGSADVIYAGDVDLWKKFANTLKLRLAMRISNVEPTLAKAYAEEAVASGVMTSSATDDALMKRNTSTYNGLSYITSWNEFRMSATMASVLNGYADPRISIYFTALSDGTYKGLRNGLSVTQLAQSANKSTTNSNVGTRWLSTADGGVSSYLSTSQNVMATAEAYFLRAEGVLKGWDMGTGTAQSFYEEGITNSMTQWGITSSTTVSAYISSTNTPAAPGDYLSSAAVSSVPVKWGSTTATQLEQISIQKWLALYPDGCEAWADNRRSRYFKLYPVVNSANTDLTSPSTTSYIRRLSYLTQETQTNAGGLATGITELGGSDKITTPLWWDTN